MGRKNGLRFENFENEDRFYAIFSNSGILFRKNRGQMHPFFRIF